MSGFMNFLHNHFGNPSPNQYFANTNQSTLGTLFGSGPKDWLANAAVFAGADTLLNKYDENNDDSQNVHYWRNAGLAGALALGFQHYRNHQHQQEQVLAYQQPQNLSYYYPQQQDYNGLMVPQQPQQQQIIMNPMIPNMSTPTSFVYGQQQPMLMNQTQNDPYTMWYLSQQQQQNPYAGYYGNYNSMMMQYSPSMGTPTMGPWPMTPYYTQQPRPYW